jgi:hypothetical protein
MHTTAAIELLDEGKSAALSLGGKRLVAHVAGVQGARFAVADADPTPSVEANPPVHGAPVRHGGKKLIVTPPAKTEKMLLSVLLTPGDETPAQQRIDLLKNWNEAKPLR